MNEIRPTNDATGQKKKKKVSEKGSKTPWNTAGRFLQQFTTACAELWPAFTGNTLFATEGVGVGPALTLGGNRDGSHLKFMNLESESSQGDHIRGAAGGTLE